MDPIGSMVNGIMSAVEPIAPHNVLPQLLAPLQSMFQGGTGAGIRERRAVRDNGVGAFQEQVANQRTAELKSGWGGVSAVNTKTGIATNFF